MDLTHKFLVNPNGSFTEVGTPWTMALDQPHGVSFDANGYVYIADRDNDADDGVYKLDCDGNLIGQTFSSITTGITPLNTVIVGDLMYWPNNNTNQWEAWSLCSGMLVGAVAYPNAGEDSWGIEVGPNGLIYVTDNFGGANGNGDVYALNPASFTLPAGSAFAPVISGLDDLIGITLDPAGNIYVVDNQGNNGDNSIVYSFTSTGTLISSVQDNTANMVGFHDAWGITYSPATGNLYVTSRDDDCAATINAATMTYTGAAAPHIPTTFAKGIEITTECCPDAPITDQVVSSCAGNTLALADFFPCDGICAGTWYRSTGTGGIYDTCTETFTLDAATTTTEFCFSRPASPNNLCGEIDFCVTIDPFVACIASNSGATCAGGSVTLTEGGGDGVSWLWSGPNGYSSTLQNPVVSPAVAGNYSVVVTDANGCSSNSCSTNVFVNNAPLVNPGNNGPACLGESVTLGESAGNATSWSWTGPNGFTSTQQNPVVNPAVGGTYTVTILDANGCTNSGTTTVVVENTPVCSASNSGPVCNGANVTLSESGGNATSWSWTGPAGFTSTLQNPTVTPAIAGVYTVVTSNAAGCTATCSTTVVTNSSSTPVATNNGPSCLGSTITLSETSGNGVSWSWTGPNGFTAVGQNAVATAAGSYTVTMTDNNGCSGTASTTVVINTLPLCNAGNNGPACAGEAVTISESAGDAVTWSWTGPNGFTSAQQSPVISPAVGGTYTVFITDVNGCTSTCSTVVQVNNNPVCAAGNSGPVCAGEAVTLTESGNTAASWLWTGPNGFTSTQQNPVVSPAVAGTYTVTIGAGTGCESSCSTNVVVNPTPIAIAGNNGPTCVGSPVTLSETGGSAVTWSWTGPNGFTSGSPSPVATAAGTYAVTITDANGCTASTTTIVSINSLPLCNAGNNGPACAGEAVTVSENAGDATSWSWTGPNGFTSTQQSPVVNPAVGGTYTVFITDANGCTSTCSTVVTVNNNPICAASNSGPVCAGESITLSESGGTASAWLWTGPNGFTSTQQNPVLSPAVAGTYTVTIGAGTGCESSCSTTVVVDSNPVVIASNSGPVCSTENLTLNETGGSAVSWTWSGPNGYSSTLQNPTVFTPMNGVYTVTVVSANGCTATGSTAVVVNPLPVCSATNNGPVCDGSGVTLSENGGNAVSWSWTGPNGFTSFTQSPLVFPALPGTYTVAITDANGCMSSCSTTIAVNAEPVCIASNNGPVCAGDFVQLSETGGEGSSWSWSGPNGFVSTAQNPTVSPAVAGTYTVVVTNPSGCVSTCTTNVVVNDNPVCAATNSGPYCAGEDMILSENGGDAVAWNWSGPNGFTSTLQNPLPIMATAGVYTVTVTSANGCTSVCSTTVAVNSAPLCSATNSGSSCAGSPVALVENGGAAVSWLWMGPNGFTATTQSATVDPALPGVYSVMITDANGCSSSCTTLISVNPAPSCIPSNNGPVCAGDALTLNETGGLAVSWSWTGPNGFTSASQAPFLPVAVAGTYTVNIVDANGCTSTCSTTVSTLENPTCSATSTDGTCGMSDGSITVVGAGGLAPYQYSIDGINFSPAGIFVNLPAGTYTTTVLDANGCSSTCSATVVVPNGPTCTALPNNVSCAGAMDGSIVASGTGIAPLTYSIDNGVTFDSNNIFTNLSGGTYTIIIMDGNGCTSTCPVIITEPTELIVATVPSTTSCFNATDGSVVSNVSGGTMPYTYSWNVAGSSSNLTNVGAGTYVLTVIDDNGCTATAAPATVVEPSEIVLTQNVINAFCQSNNGSIDLTVNGGTPTYTYDWSIDGLGDNDDAQDLSNLAPGSYTVIVTDANGCSSTQTYTITEIGCVYDLALVKTTTQTVAIPGEEVTYTITVLNQGTVDATAAVISDYIPAGMSLSANDNNGWNGGPTGTVATTLNNIPAGGNASVDIVLLIDPSFTGSMLDNCAEITVDSGDDIDSTPDSFPNNDVNVDNVVDNTGGDEDDHDCAVIFVEYYDLALAKFVQPGNASVEAGDDVPFFIEVTNQGNQPASNVQIADYIPAGMSLSALDTNGWTGGTTGTVFNTIPAIAPGQTVILDIILTVDANFMGTSLENWAEISADNGDDIDSNPNADISDDVYGGNNIINNANGDEDDHDVAPIIVQQDFDLALNKELTPSQPGSPFGVGDDIEFTIVVYNQGTVDATNVEVTDYLPANVVVSANDTNGWVTNAAGNAVTTIPTIPAGGTATIEILVTVQPGFQSSTLTNLAEITEDNGDDVDSTPDTFPNNDPLTDDVIDNSFGDEDDHDIATVTIIQSFDLALTKTAAAGSYSPGDDVVYTITVFNQGSVDATDIEVVDALPVNTTLSANDNNGWTAGLGGTLVNTIPALAAGASATIEIIATIDPNFPGGSIDNFAEILSASGIDIDSTPGNLDPNEDDVDIATIVIAVYDLALVKTVNASVPAVVLPGDFATFDITVINQGPTDVYNVSIVDYLPQDLSLADVDWSLVGGVPTYVIPGPIAPGQSVTVEITTLVDPNIQMNGIIENLAEIASAEDGLGNLVSDIDSDWDDFPNNDGDILDNEINNANGDEDDHDVANIISNVNLSVQLVSFEGKGIHNGNLLSWMTSSELNNHYFTLEKSIDAVNFEYVAQVEGHGTAQVEHSYEFLDNNVTAGVVYYRLSQTDFDGEREDLGIITITRAEDQFTITSISPVPAKNNLTVHFNAPGESLVNFRIIDATGKEVFANNMKAVLGQNEQRISIVNFASGIYFLQIVNDENVVRTQKFIKE